MLSASSSFIATNCPDLILLANFAPIGGSAEERITAPSAAGLRLEQDGLALKTVVAVAVAPAVAVATTVAAAADNGENTASPASADDDGMTPRPGVAVPACIPRMAYSSTGDITKVYRPTVPDRKIRARHVV